MAAMRRREPDDDLPEATNQGSKPSAGPSPGQPFPNDQCPVEVHRLRVVAEPSGGDHCRTDAQKTIVPADPSAADQVRSDAQKSSVGGGTISPAEPKTGTTATGSAARLADHWLLICSDAFDDFERTRIATENRARALRQVKGMDGTREEARMLAVCESLRALEHQMELDLGRALRAHPFGPWVKRTVGVGEKQGARLLAAIGDPYWKHTEDKAGNVLDDRPRRGPAELWAYCGYHVLHPGQNPRADHHHAAGVDPLGPDHPPFDDQAGRIGADPSSRDHRPFDAQGRNVPAQPSDTSDHKICDDQEPHVAGVAPRRAKGQKANWNDTAKMRAYLVAEKCIMFSHSPYRPVYDDARAKYADAVHNHPCARCGPKGKPAAVGSPLSAGHQHGRALRLVAKAILRDLWIEGRRLHQESAS